MGKRWAKRWSFSGKGHRRNNIHAVRITPSASVDPVVWSLPPSKSHLIRALLLAAQAPVPVDLSNVQNAGEDARSMRRCLQQLGVKIDDYSEKGDLLHHVNPVNYEHHPDATTWRVHGVGGSGFTRPASVLNANNSGTTLRLLGPHAGLIGGPVMLDGDASLRRRSSKELWASIEQAGVTLSVGMGQERLPALLEGPMSQSNLEAGIHLDISRSSQPLSAWILATPSLPCPTTISLEGDAVSSRHSALSKTMLKLFGGDLKEESNQLKLTPEKLTPPEVYEIPGDASMAAFSLLACCGLNRKVKLHGWPDMANAVGHELLESSSTELGVKWETGLLSSQPSVIPVNLDLRDANDLLPPLSAVLAMNAGGRLFGATHAAYKESNRLTRTVELLNQFGLKASLAADGLTIEGNQSPTAPTHPVDTFGDHRLFMTAVLLASICGGDVIGQDLHTVADEDFLDRLRRAGIGVEAVVLPPLADQP